VLRPERDIQKISHPGSRSEKYAALGRFTLSGMTVRNVIVVIWMFSPCLSVGNIALAEYDANAFSSK